MQEVTERIRIDIDKFSESVSRVSNAKLGKKEIEVVELAKMYASDASDWLAKKDYYTAFASISYAHGLLDAVLKLEGLSE